MGMRDNSRAIHVHFDKGFRPNIRKEIGDAFSELMEVWGMEPIGEPVPAEKLVKVAVWFGQRLSVREQVPVLAASTDPDLPLSKDDTTWFCGIADISEVIESSAPLLTLTDSASTPAPNPIYALRNLSTLLPITSYDLTHQKFIEKSDVLTITPEALGKH